MAFIPLSSELGLLARALVRCRGSIIDAALLLEAEHSGSRVARIARSAVAAGTTADPAWAAGLIDYQQVSAGYIEGLRTASAFARIWNDEGFRRAPMNTRLAVVATAATGAVVGERKPKPVSSLALEVGTLDPIKAICILVISAEVAMGTSAGAQALLNGELRGGVASAIDSAFVGIITLGIIPIVSSGSTAGAILADLRKMASAVNSHASGRLYWLASPAVINGLATTPDGSGGLAFPGVALNGSGELLGAPLLATDAVALGSLVLVDAREVLADMGQVLLDVSTDAALELDTSPTDPPVDSTVLYSLFQHDARALRAEAFFAARRVRDTAVAELTGLDFPATP